MGFFDFGKKKQKQVKTPSQYQIVTKNDIDNITKIINKDFPIILRLLKKHIKGFVVSNKKEYFYRESKEYPGYMEFRYKIDLGSVNIYKFCEDWDDFIFGPFEEFENDLENKLKYDAISYTHHVSPQNDLVSLSCNDGEDENGNYPFSFGCYKAYVKIESSVSESLNNIKDILTDLSIFEEEYDIFNEGFIDKAKQKIRENSKEYKIVKHLEEIITENKNQYKDFVIGIQTRSGGTGSISYSVYIVVFGLEEEVYNPSKNKWLRDYKRKILLENEYKNVVPKRIVENYRKSFIKKYIRPYWM